MDASGSALMQIVAYVFVLVVLFLLFRFIVLWYWRVNEIVDQLRAVNEKLALLIPKQVGETGPTIATVEFEAWLRAQNRQPSDLSADELASYRQAYDYKRKMGEL